MKARPAIEKDHVARQYGSLLCNMCSYHYLMYNMYSACQEKTVSMYTDTEATTSVLFCPCTCTLKSTLTVDMLHTEA